MARINIEDSLFKDFRFIQLAMKLGCVDIALGALVRAWSLSQSFYLKNGGQIPIVTWESQAIPNEIIEVGLATKDDEFVTMRGVNDQFSWLKQKSDAGRKNIEEFNQRRSTGVNVRTSSSSYSSYKEKKKKAGEDKMHVRKAHDLSPRRDLKIREVIRTEWKGSVGNHAAGARELSSLVADNELETLAAAMRNFSIHKLRNDEYFPHVKTWAKEWRDWIPGEQGAAVDLVPKIKSAEDL